MTKHITEVVYTVHHYNEKHRNGEHAAEPEAGEESDTEERQLLGSRRQGYLWLFSLVILGWDWSMIVPSTKTEQSRISRVRVEGPTVSKGELGIGTPVGHRDESVEDSYHLWKQRGVGPKRGTQCVETFLIGQD